MFFAFTVQSKYGLAKNIHVPARGYSLVLGVEGYEGSTVQKSGYDLAFL
jgi:hypothetical protein